MKLHFLGLAALLFLTSCVSVGVTRSEITNPAPAVIVVTPSQLVPGAQAHEIAPGVMIAQADPSPVPSAAILADAPVGTDAGSVDGEAIAADALAPPSWLVGAVGVLCAIFPGVGAAILLVCKGLGMVSVLLTALSLFITTVAGALKGVFNVAGLLSVSSAIAAIEEKVQRYVRYASVFNVQKK